MDAGINFTDSQWETLLESAYKKVKESIQPLTDTGITEDDIVTLVKVELGKVPPNVPVDTIVGLIQQELNKLKLSVNVAPAQQVTPTPQPDSVSNNPTGVAS